MKKLKCLIVELCFAALILVVCGFYMVSALSANRRAVNEFSERVFAELDTAELLKLKQLKNVPGYLDLYKQRSLLSAKYELARLDSTSLILNISDSTASIVLKGVAVKKIKLESLELSPIFAKMDPLVLYTVFAKPMNVISSRTTIPRESFIVKQAPSDTTELPPLRIPDTSYVTPIYYGWTMDNGMEVNVYQSDVDEASESMRETFQNIEWRRDVVRNFRWAFGMKCSPYVPMIKLTMPWREAKTLYRALPQRTKVLIII